MGLCVGTLDQVSEGHQLRLLLEGPEEKAGEGPRDEHES